MREYVITVIFVNGQVMNRATANQYLAQRLMKIFIKHDRVVDVQIKDSQRQREIKRSRQSQVDD